MSIQLLNWLYGFRGRIIRHIFHTERDELLPWGNHLKYRCRGNYPKKFPIYDQHVHRAMASLKGWKDIEIPSYNKKKIESYLINFLPFWGLFSDFKSKKVDKALWAYGRFLKLGYEFD